MHAAEKLANSQVKTLAKMPTAQTPQAQESREFWQNCTAGERRREPWLAYTQTPCISKQRHDRTHTSEPGISKQQQMHSSIDRSHTSEPGIPKQQQKQKTSMLLACQVYCDRSHTCKPGIPKQQQKQTPQCCLPAKCTVTQHTHGKRHCDCSRQHHA